jgi:hypothetical protein
MSSTWETRDLPVLKAIVAIEEESGRFAMVDAIAERTGLDDEQVQRAVGALSREEPSLFEVIDASSMGGTHYAGAGDITGHARRVVGAWPTPESLADRLIAALEDTAANGEDEEHRSWAKRALEGGKGVGKGVLTSVLVKVLTEGI